MKDTHTHTYTHTHTHARAHTHTHTHTHTIFKQGKVPKFQLQLSLSLCRPSLFLVLSFLLTKIYCKSQVNVVGLSWSFADVHKTENLSLQMCTCSAVEHDGLSTYFRSCTVNKCALLMVHSLPYFSHFQALCC